MAVTCGGQYDEALERFHRTGPEFEGWLSNHGPMAVEAMARRGSAGDIHSWCDRCVARLDDRPRGIETIDEEGWRDPLGDPVRTGDWLNFFDRAVRQRPWQETLATWWPRLLPGIAAGATHGVIRVGHAVSALQNAETHRGWLNWVRHWPTGQPDGSRSVCRPCAETSVSDRHGPLFRLSVTSDSGSDTACRSWRRPWVGAMRSALCARHHETGFRALSTLVATSLEHCATEAHSDPTMLVHACTAPNAVATVLPSLPRNQWEPSYRAVWAATAAVVAAYRPPAPIAAVTLPSPDPGDLLDAAMATRSEHAIKLVDTALRAHERCQGPEPLVAGWTAVQKEA